MNLKNRGEKYETLDSGPIKGKPTILKWQKKKDLIFP